MRFFGKYPSRKKINGARRSVVLLGGALGDCVLSLTLVHELRNRGPVCMLTRDAYFPIIKGIELDLEIHSIDSSKTASLFSKPDLFWQPVFTGSSVYNFLNDREGRLQTNLQQLGAANYCQLPSHPEQPPHIVEQMFTQARLPYPAGALETAMLGQLRNKPGSHYWIHPGSGSPAKNAPMECLRQTYESDPRRLPILASFGEADHDLVPCFQKVFAGLDFKILKPLNIAVLLHELAEKAAIFLGNDSGPAHLAAALGLPTTVIYRSTNPLIWKPVGLEVTVRSVKCSDWNEKPD